MTRLPDKASSRAVLIGCERFESAELTNLPAVRDNLVDLKDLLASPESGSFEKRHVSVLKSVDCFDVRGVYEALREAAQSATDTFLVYYAGHGLTSMRRNGLHLCLTNTDPDALSVSGLSIDMIREIFLDCPARNRILILDCCFSGRGTTDYMASPSEAMAGQSEIAGTYTMASAPPNSVSLALPGERYTAFTGGLIEMLRDGELDGPELLTLDVLYRGLRKRMEARGFPIPTQRGTDLSYRLAIGRNPSYLFSGYSSCEATEPLGGENPHTGGKIFPSVQVQGPGRAAAYGSFFALLSGVAGVISWTVYAHGAAPVIPRMQVVVSYVSNAILVIAAFAALARVGIRRPMLPVLLGACLMSIPFIVVNILNVSYVIWIGAWGSWAEGEYGYVEPTLLASLVGNAFGIAAAVILLAKVRISGRAPRGRSRISPPLAWGGVVLSVIIFSGVNSGGLSSYEDGLSYIIPYSADYARVGMLAANLVTAVYVLWLSLGSSSRFKGGNTLLLGWIVMEFLWLISWTPVSAFLMPESDFNNLPDAHAFWVDVHGHVAWIFWGDIAAEIILCLVVAVNAYFMGRQRRDRVAAPSAH